MLFLHLFKTEHRHGRQGTWDGAASYLHTVFVSLLEMRVFMERRCSGGVYGVMKTRRGQSSSFMAMEPSVTLEVRTSCRTSTNVSFISAIIIMT